MQALLDHEFHQWSTISRHFKEEWKKIYIHVYSLSSNYFRH